MAPHSDFSSPVHCKAPQTACGASAPTLHVEPLPEAPGLSTLEPHVWHPSAEPVVAVAFQRNMRRHRFVLLQTGADLIRAAQSGDDRPIRLARRWYEPAWAAE